MATEHSLTTTNDSLKIPEERYGADTSCTDTEMESIASDQWEVTKQAEKRKPITNQESSGMKLKLVKLQPTTKWLEDPQLRNRYEALQNINQEKENETTSSTPKPPPIFIDAPNIDPLIKTLKQLVEPSEIKMRITTPINQKQKGSSK